MSAEFAEWSTAGLETVFFLFLLLLAFDRLLTEAENGGRPLSPVFFALAALTRPEGAAFFAGAAALLALIRLVAPGRHRLSPKGIAIRVSLFAALYVPYFVWRALYCGRPLPNTYYAKYWPGGGASYVAEFLLYLGPVALLALAALVRVFHPRSSSAFRLATLLAWALFLVNAGGVWNVQPAMGWDWRLLLHLIPLLMVLAAAVAVPFLQAERRGVRVLAVGAVALTVVWCAHPHLLRGRVQEARACSEGMRNAHVKIGKWLQRIAPPGAVVATVDTGAIPYFSRLPAVDIANIALHDEERASPRRSAEEYEEGLWRRDPKFFVVRTDEKGSIAAHGLRESLIRRAVEKGFVPIQWAMYREDYFLSVYADPLAIRTR